MDFLIETVGGQVVNDFSFALYRAKEYLDWDGRAELNIHRHEGNDFSDIREPDRFIPCGSVGFVSAYLLAFYPERREMLRPLNVPGPLMQGEYAGRPMRNVFRESDMPRLGKDVTLFLKGMDTIKDPSNGPALNPSAGMCVGFQVSTVLELLSEWRVFVFHDEVQHVANYGGDSLIFPDRDAILRMVEAYREESPVAYTLDVGVTARGTYVIECHRLFSCGLYGFSDWSKYPFMLSQEWFEIKSTR